MFKGKQPKKNQVSWAACAGIGALLVGVTLHKTSAIEGLGERLASWSASTTQSQQLMLTPRISEKSIMHRLVQTRPTERKHELEALAQQQKSIDANRARYLLASDLIAGAQDGPLGQQQGKKAIALLEKLEQDYPVLASHIAVKRAQARQMMGSEAGAEAAWKDVLRRYGEDPVAAEALFELGKTNPKYWDKAIAEFPAHPKTVEIVKARLREENSDKLPLLLILAKYALYEPEWSSFLGRLVSQYKDELTAEDWEAIAYGYWEKEAYGEAGAAYMKAPATPKNRYRAGRGLQLGGKKKAASRAYEQLIAEFPDAEITARGMLHLSRISEPKYALEYIDTIQTKFPEFAASALLEKSRILGSLGSAKGAFVARESILSQYSNSEEAAKLRWRLAQKRAQAGEFTEAWEWAQQLTVENPDSPLAAEAAFWVGKWAQRMGQTAEADRAFEYVVMRYPESYYAWRSAVFLGWDVGDFSTLRTRSPQLERLPLRPLLPAGTEVLKELYQLGQDTDAWKLWQVEFTNRREPTVEEQFTDGLIRLTIGDYLEGIFMINSLNWRESREDREQLSLLKQKPAYWYALYPFPYHEQILTWSRERQLNPLLVVALIRQESRFMSEIESPVGAKGLMQVMPETAAWIATQINITDYQMSEPLDNIKLGTWYLNFTHGQYENNSMLAVASYNAGSTNVFNWIDRYDVRDWDDFVELIPFRETKGYVKSVLGNYWNYARLYDPKIAKKVAQQKAALTAEKSSDSPGG